MFTFRFRPLVPRPPRPAGSTSTPPALASTETYNISSSSNRGTPATASSGSRNINNSTPSTVRKNSTGGTAAAAMQQSTERGVKGPNFSYQEVTNLLTLIERMSPRNFRDWSSIATELYSVFPQCKRTGDGCRRKFLALCNWK